MRNARIGAAARTRSRMREARPPASRRRLLSLILVASCVLPAARPSAVAAASASGAPPYRFYHAYTDTLHLRAAANLARHVDRAELAAWRDTCGAEAASAFDFLFAWLPSCDLSAWRGSAVESDIALALRTRSETPWRVRVNDEIFRRYVLPHRVAQEPVQPWRATLHDLLWDRVKDRSLWDAALETNRFCREYVTFQPTSARDQGPLTTMDRGRGRCEEEQIFYISAARSVGIPARPCFTPWWMAGDNNHAWVEVWTGDGWHYLGACEPAPDLDQAWFTEPARRAGLVLSIAYGQGEFPEEEVYSQSAGTTLINSTAVYNRTGTVHVEDAEPSAVVHLHVFNAGGLREIGSFRAGEGIRLGPADYVATAVLEGHPVAALLTVHADASNILRFPPPEEASFDFLEKPFWIRIPFPPADPAAATRASRMVDPLVQKTHEASLAGNDLARAQRSRPDAGLLAALAARCCSPAGGAAGPALEDLLAQLDLSGPHWSEWAAFLAATPVAEFPTGCGLVEEMDDKDFFECDTTSARTALARSLEIRARREHGGASVPDSIWFPYVISPRIDRQPGDLWLWRDLPVLTQSGGPGPEDAPLLPAEGIHAFFAARVRKVAPERLGHIATPSQTLRASLAGASNLDSCLASPAAARVALVGLLRRNGIPARVEPERRWIEAWVDGAWVPSDPFGSWNRRPQSASSVESEVPGTLDVSFLDLGAPMTNAEAEVHFALAHFTDGAFQPLYNELPASGGRLIASLEPGDWWLMGGQRNHAGDARVLLRHFALAGGDTVRMAVDLGIPPEERDPQDLAPRQVPPEGTRILREAARNGSPVLALLWTRDSEPSTRTAEAVRSGREALRKLGLSIVTVEITAAPGSSGGALHTTGIKDRGGVDIPGSTGIRVAPDLARSAFDLGADPPLVVILDGEGRTRLRLEGMQLAVVDLARQAMSPRQRD